MIYKYILHRNGSNGEKKKLNKVTAGQRNPSLLFTKDK